MQARYYKMLPNQKILCELCPHACQIPANQAGFCNVRRHRDGMLLTTNYGRVSGIALEPIEKKPLYHFFPGRPILSVGTVGCNLACEFCQNWEISREAGRTTRPVSPSGLRDLAVRTHRENGNIGVAYTYSEPVVWFEFLMDTMPLIRDAGLQNVLVTNGLLRPAPWRKLLQYTDAANIDLKGFTPEYYQRFCHGQLQPVLKNIQAAAGRIHLELTVLIVPEANDQPEQIAAMAGWIAKLDPGIPLHLSRYFPNYHMKQPPTPPETMFLAGEIAKAYLKYVYLGNLGCANNTYCAKCDRLLIAREGYETSIVTTGYCPDCGDKIPVKTERLTEE
jgi:pyruvate formate lyase activating enzyme